jgi:hypothetical protein
LQQHAPCFERLMASAIEKLLFEDLAEFVSPTGAVGGHGILEIILSELKFELFLMPRGTRWGTAPKVKVARFSGAKLRELRQAIEYPEELELPWTIRGFLSDELGDDRWRFLLICDEVRIEWESEWPVVERDIPYRWPDTWRY